MAKSAKGLHAHIPNEGVEPDYAQVERKFEKLVRSKGYKLTSQRRRILKKVFTTHEHFTAEALHETLQRGRDPISRATIYRTLRLLVEGGFLDVHDFGADKKYYEHVLGHEQHDHIVCLDCEKILEFHDEGIMERQRDLAESHGFKIDRHSLRIFARCTKSDCPDRPTDPLPTPRS